MTSKPTPIPDIFAPWFTPEGKPTSDAYQWFLQIDKVIRLTVDFVDTSPPADPEYEMLEDWSLFVQFPSDKSYTLIQNNQVERTVTASVSKAVSGTCTATVKINTTAVGGTANAVSSTEQSQAHASSNVLGVGDDLVVTISSNANCRDMALNVKTTRTLTA